MTLLNIFYVIAAFISTVIGSLVGIGGGIVLKSMTDFFSPDPVQVIAFYMTVGVFTMSIVSITKQVKSGFKYDVPMLIQLSVGSMAGGYFGNHMLDVLLACFAKNTVQITQSAILLLTLLFLIVYMRAGSSRKRVEHPNWMASLSLGFFLGAISIFLAIGGGPLNVSLLVIFFGFSLREAAIYSIASIFFAQIAKVFTILLANDYSQYDLKLVPWLVLTTIVGGYIGTTLSQRLSSRSLNIMYNIFMVMLVALTTISLIRHV